MKEFTIGDYGWWSVFRTERSRMHQYIFKNFNTFYKKKPDYVLCSVFGNQYTKYEGIRILYSAENLCPDFNIFDYAIGFEQLEFGDRYIRIPNWIMNLKYEQIVEEMKKKHINADELFQMKKNFCSFVYSNSNAHEYRRKIFEAISCYKKVSSGGKYLNNIGGPVVSKKEFERIHKFSIVCENSSHIGYTTEKLVEAFAAGTIPIYWGDPWVTKVFNEKAFINIMDYGSIEEVIYFIQKIDNNDELYLGMLRQPALIEEYYIENKIKELEFFLQNIFKQEYNKAFRRNSYRV